MSANLTREDIDPLREGYRLFREHPAFMDRFALDATFVYPTTLRAGGTYADPWEALEFTTTVSDRVDDPHSEPEEFIGDGDRVVVLGTWHAVVPSSGRHATVRFAHVFTWSGEGPLTGRKARSFELICDTVSFAAALAEGDAAEASRTGLL
jgi:hypothetical protein